VDNGDLRTWATVFAAVGTVGALVYVLFRDLWLANRRRPRLDLRFHGTGADQVIVPTMGGTAAAYVRLRVANEKGKDTADDVQVLVTEIERQDSTSQATPVGLPLVWSGSLPASTNAPVHPGVERYIDLLHVIWPIDSEGAALHAEADEGSAAHIGARRCLGVHRAHSWLRRRASERPPPPMPPSV
jgi:hypothetical protein